MTFARHLLLAAVLAAGCMTQAQADSFASSASSAGSASSGSISTSLNGSSNSSSGNDKIANGPYRIDRVEALAQAPGRPGMVRLSMQAEQVNQQLTLDLPAAVFAKQHLGQGDLVDVQRRDYGFQFAHADTRAAFFLVLADDWHDELAARPVTL
jgi:opacity protein-like surface antigen